MGTEGDRRERRRKHKTRLIERLKPAKEETGVSLVIAPLGGTKRGPTKRGRGGREIKSNRAPFRSTVDSARNPVVSLVMAPLGGDNGDRVESTGERKEKFLPRAMGSCSVVEEDWGVIGNAGKIGKEI
ncbi:uncharacterized protein LOC143266657 [Megachile rotundata]|uniref:uncharacterized protein LOC143266657 n=1 Tax=Megachile rotundata TaxID=143995 RepID=UPI003FD4D3EB